MNGPPVSHVRTIPELRLAGNAQCRDLALLQTVSVIIGTQSVVVVVIESSRQLYKRTRVLGLVREEFGPREPRVWQTHGARPLPTLVAHLGGQCRRKRQTCSGRLASEPGWLVRLRKRQHSRRAHFLRLRCSSRSASGWRTTRATRDRTQR